MDSGHRSDKDDGPDPHDRAMRSRALQFVLQLVEEDREAAWEVVRCLRERVVCWFEGGSLELRPEPNPVVRELILDLARQLPPDPRDARLVVHYLSEDVLPWLEGRKSIAPVRRRLELVKDSVNKVAAATVIAAMVLRIRTGYLDSIIEGIATFA